MTPVSVLGAQSQKNDAIPPFVYAPPVNVPGAQSQKSDAIPHKWFNSFDTNLVAEQLNLGRQKLIKYETASNYPVSFLASQDIWTCLNAVQELFLSNIYDLNLTLFTGNFIQSKPKIWQGFCGQDTDHNSIFISFWVNVRTLQLKHQLEYFSNQKKHASQRTHQIGVFTNLFHDFFLVSAKVGN